MSKKRVVFYGRVSTQSEEQLSALGNQMSWYDQLLMQHPDWEMVGKYEDAGITGTSVRKRKGFQRMLEDGLLFHQYDMIITRETKRFARNTVDALSYVRLLKDHGIQVYFVSDAIRTIEDRDGELRLSIMATIAQEESRKTSENVRAGQRISRQKGILRGTGNILGYRRTGKNQYEIDPEQAIIVKKIYQWYLSGEGIRGIKRRLEEEGHKTATGKEHWQLQAIDNVLKNPFYIGKQRQLAWISDGYLTQKRVKNFPEKIEYIQGNYEPIIPEEVFQEVGAIRKARYSQIHGKGKKGSKSVWCGRYLCGCGRGTVKRTAGSKESVFLCYWQHVNGRRREGQEREKEPEGCGLKSVAEWQLDMIAYFVLRDLWDRREEDLEQAGRVIEECFQEENGFSLQERQLFQRRMEQLEKRRDSLVDMRADGEITKEEYALKRQEYEEELGMLKQKALEEGKDGELAGEKRERKSDGIKQALSHLMDFSCPKLNRDIVDGFIQKLIHISDYEFALFLWAEGSSPEPEGKTLVLTFKDASWYRSMSGKRVMKGKWEDLVIHIHVSAQEFLTPATQEIIYRHAFP